MASDFAHDGFWVYRLMSSSGLVLYVGQSVDLEARLKTHMTQAYGDDIEFVMAARCDSRKHMNTVESALIAGYNPPLNKNLTRCDSDVAKAEADSLVDSLEWQVVPGFGTMFRSMVSSVSSGDSCAIRTRRITFSTTDRIYDAIENAAYDRHMSKSRLIEQALVEFLVLD